jgi:hypothetical protein
MCLYATLESLGDARLDGAAIILNDEDIISNGGSPSNVLENVGQDRVRPHVRIALAFKFFFLLFDFSIGH